MINPIDFGIKGLSDEAVKHSRKKHGENSLSYKRDNSFLDALKSIINGHPIDGGLFNLFYIRK